MLTMLVGPVRQWHGLSVIEAGRDRCFGVYRETLDLAMALLHAAQEHPSSELVTHTVFARTVSGALRAVKRGAKSRHLK